MIRYLKTSLLLVVLISMGCNQGQSKDNAAKVDSAEANSVLANVPDILAGLADLVPITVVDSASQNVYEKYGIEFSGNCYECDLATISVDKKQFDIINVCDRTDFEREEQFSYEVLQDELIITTSKSKFVFKKIDKTPIYELKILGEKLTLGKKRFSQFYTPKAGLKKFKQHDCGEFEG